MKYITTEKLIVKSWCNNPEDEAIEQAKHLACLPFAFKWICLMPDTHCGYGMPIGGVLATKGVIIPNAVGVDVGCGMCAIKTPWTTEEINTNILKIIMGKIRDVIPLGFNSHKEEQDISQMPITDWLKWDCVEIDPYYVCGKEYKKTLKSLGTLGGGNHFIEIQKDSNNLVWIMIHSGSRNLGYKVCNYYNKIAQEFNKKWHSSIPQKWDLSFLPIDTKEGQAYLNEMNYCVAYAFANRKLMMSRIVNIFNDTMKWKKVDTTKMINVAHNYVRIENHFGENVWVHRKGATSACKEEIGIIPGSQGTSSYIVHGLGNIDSFMSCSHGAGRTMSRKVAKDTLNLEIEIKRLNDKGIIHSIRNKDDLDEAPSSYKDIDVVMEEQKDLVQIIEKLAPLAVIKG